MAHNDVNAKIIHSINIGGTAYEVHDKEAVHTLSDLEALGLAGAFIYKGSVANKAALPTTGNKIGYVYHVVNEDQEYVWAKIGEGAEAWEEFGAHISVDHIHDVTVTGTTNTAILFSAINIVFISFYEIINSFLKLWTLTHFFDTIVKSSAIVDSS